MTDEVTQADFDAAQEWWNGTEGLRLAEFQGLAEAFAKHRLASESRSSDIEAERDRLRYLLGPLANLAATDVSPGVNLNDPIGKWFTIAQIQEASAALQEAPNVE